MIIPEPDPAPDNTDPDIAEITPDEFAEPEPEVTINDEPPSSEKQTDKDSTKHDSDSINYVVSSPNLDQALSNSTPLPEALQVSDIADALEVPGDADNMEEQTLSKASSETILEQSAGVQEQDPYLRFNQHQADINAMQEALDAMKEEIDDTENTEEVTFEEIVKEGATFSLSAGILTWALRVGSLLSTLLSTLPLWRWFDPLPVLSLSKEEREEKEKEITAEEDDEARKTKDLGNILD